jgi:hypothetical protein
MGGPRAGISGKAEVPAGRAISASSVQGEELRKKRVAAALHHRPQINSHLARRSQRVNTSQLKVLPAVLRRRVVPVLQAVRHPPRAEHCKKKAGGGVKYLRNYPPALGLDPQYNP